MVEDIAEDQVRNGVPAKRKLISIADLIYPGMGEEISAQCGRAMLLKVSHAGANFDNSSRLVLINPLQDLLIKPGVQLSQQGLPFPHGAVLKNLPLVLR